MIWLLLGAWFPYPALAQAVQESPPPASPARWATPGKVRALAFVPIPGFPSLVQGDLGNAGLSWALTAPTVAVWVAATQRTGEWPAERIAVSAGGAYAATVVINVVTGMRSFRRPSVSVVPVEGGGAMVSMHARW